MAAATLLRAEVTPRNKDGISRWDTRPRAGKVRVFVSVKPDEYPTPSGPMCRGSVKCGVLGPVGCGEVDHAVWRRGYLRPALAEMRSLVAEALGREAFEELGRLRFSTHAGCRMCPCSPGFITDAVGSQDLFITLEVAR